VLWALNADKITSFVSHSVLSGFTSGAGITIFLSQLKYITGQEPPRFHFAYEYFTWYVTHVEDSVYDKLASIVIGLTCMAWLYFFKWFKRKYPPNEERNARRMYRYTVKMGDFSTLIMIIASAIVSYLLIDQGGVNLKVIGAIPNGMKAPSIPTFSPEDFNKVVVNCVVLAILSYMESFAIGTKFADLAGYRLDNSQELLAIGASNIIGSMFSGYLSAGSFSRTAVNAKAGSQSPLSCIVTAVLVLAGLYVTEIFYYIPFAALAAIIETSIVNIIDIEAMRHAWKVNKPDFIMMFVSFIVTLFFGMEMGIIVGVVLSILLLVKATATPHWAVLGKVLIDPLSITESERNVTVAKEALDMKRIEFLAQNESLGVDRAHSLQNYERAVNTNSIAAEALPPMLRQIFDLKMLLIEAKIAKEKNESMEAEELAHEHLLSHTYRDVARYPNAEIDPQVGIFRFESRLYFANSAFFRDKVTDVMDGRVPGAGPPGEIGPVCVIVDCTPVNSLDLSAVHMLEELADLFKRREKTLLFCGIKGAVRDFLLRAGFTAHVGQEVFFPSIDEAMTNAMSVNRGQFRNVVKSASYRVALTEKKHRGSMIQGPSE